MNSPKWQAEEITILEFHNLLRKDPSIGPKLVAQYLNAIAHHDETLKTLITINPQATTTAKEKALQTITYINTNTPFPPLHSVPIILKDNIATRDLPTTAGVKALSTLSTKDSDLAAHLRAAGAIILAKSNLHEFALHGLTLSSRRGQTRNPYDLTRTPGGSSGGTGAALAANFALVGCGTDTMNSLRSPASACAVVGFRPSTGRVSGRGIVPVSCTQDTAGPMGRCVADVRVLDRVMSGAAGAARSRSGRVRVGVLEAYFCPEGGIVADVDAGADYLAENRVVRDVVRRALHSVQETDGEIVLVSIPSSGHPDWSSEVLLAMADTQAFEFKHCLEEFLKSSLVLETPHRSLESISQSGEFDLNAVTDVFFAAMDDPETFSMTSEAYRGRLAYITALKESVKECFDAYDIDALAYPHQRQLPVKIGAKKQSGRNGILAALTGRPAICIPAGWSPKTESAPLGLPVGLELMGRQREDDELLDLAERVEKILKCRREPVLA